MSKTLLTMAAVGALAVAAPAAAQTAHANVGMGISHQITQLESRIQAGIQAGVITRTEARALRTELRQLRRLETQYSYNGLTQAERRDLRERLRDLRQDVRIADGGRFARDNRYGNWSDKDDVYADRVDRNNDGWDDRDLDRDGRWDDDRDVYASRIDRNNDGWDDRDTDRDGRWDDNVYTGQGGPYEEAYCEPRSGIGGILSSVLGRGDDNCTTLRVGQRATGNLGAVPYELRYQYRDGNGVYYRSDGRAIYQIDARTHTVLRIYDMNR